MQDLQCYFCVPQLNGSNFDGKQGEMVYLYNVDKDDNAAKAMPIIMKCLSCKPAPPSACQHTNAV